MKKLLFLFTVMIASFSVQAQVEEKSVKISGKVNVSINEEASGINVYNINNGLYTFTDEYGRFKITVKEDDELVFSSVQFQQFSVIITKSVIDKKELNIDVSAKANVLEEIVVKPNLTGDVRVDLKKVETQDMNYSGSDWREVIYGSEYDIRQDEYNTAENSAVDKGYLQHGINFVNIFKEIFAVKNKQKDSQPENMDVQIRKLYNDEFFSKYLNIKEESINDFVFFMEERGLNVDKMRSMNDLELIQFVIAESEDYKNQNQD